MLNIAIDIRCLLSPYPTGIGHYTRELLSAIFTMDQTNQYYLFSNSSAALPTHFLPWRADNIHYLHTRWPNKVFNASIATGLVKLETFILKKLITNTNPQFPVSNFQFPHFDTWFSPNLNFTTLEPQTKHILTIHDLSFELFPEYFSLKQRLWHRASRPRAQCENASHIIVPSEHTKRDLINFYNQSPDKISVLYPGLSAQFKSPLEGGAGDVATLTNISPPSSRRESVKIKTKYHLPDNYFLFVGALEPRKNILGLIEAFELFSNHRSRTKDYGLRTTDYSLVLAGPPGYQYEKIIKKISQSTYKEKIIQLGYVEEADKPAFYRNASLFLYPSFYEGFGFPVLEALSQGVPVITSNRTSLPEITGSAAWLVNPNKPAEIAAGMTTLLGNETINHRLIEDGRKEASKFNWQNTAEKWTKLIEG